MRVLILAAGLGTRLRPLTKSLPKVLVPVLEVPILERIVAFLARAGITRIAINTHHLAQQLESHIAALRARWPGLTVQTFHEPKILGTGGAIPNLGAFWNDEPLLVWNGDVLADFDLAKLALAHEQSAALATLVVQDRPYEPSRLLVDGEGRIVGIDSPSRGGRRVLAGPHPPAPSPKGEGVSQEPHPGAWVDRLSPFAFTGISLLSPALRPRLDRRAPFDLLDALLDAVAVGEAVRAHFLGRGLWGTCGTQAEWSQLEADLRAHPDKLKRFRPTA